MIHIMIMTKNKQLNKTSIKIIKKHNKIRYDIVISTVSVVCNNEDFTSEYFFEFSKLILDKNS